MSWVRRLLCSWAVLTIVIAGRPGLAGVAVTPGKWIRLCEAPDDPAGREIRPGMDSALCYSPELKGFLLYGGSTPTYSNAAWLLDPAKKKWSILHLDDSLERIKDPRLKRELGGEYRVKRPGEIVWSKDRPGPACARRCTYDAKNRAVWFYGGWRYGVSHWGSGVLGLWKFDGKSGKFTDLGAGKGLSVPDSTGRAVVAASDFNMLILAPSRRSKTKGATWGFNVGTSAWKKLATAPDAPAAGAAMVYDSANRKAVLFDEKARTWIYDPATNKWTDAKPKASPPGRRHAGAWFDAKRKKVFLHGGIAGKANGGVVFTRHGKGYSDTWTYDVKGSTWKDTGAAGPDKPHGAGLHDRYFRDCTAYSTELDVAVMTDSIAGTWVYRVK